MTNKEVYVFLIALALGSIFGAALWDTFGQEFPGETKIEIVEVEKECEVVMPDPVVCDVPSPEVVYYEDQQIIEELNECQTNLFDVIEDNRDKDSALADVTGDRDNWKEAYNACTGE